MFRQATIKDLDRISEIYDAIHTREEQGQYTTGWLRGIYPTRAVGAQGISEGDLFVEVEGDTVVAAARINREQTAAYREVMWENDAPDAQIMVLHTLVVDPAREGRGYGRRFVRFYEDYARAQGASLLRMDTNAINTRARALYRSLGYREAGTVRCAFNGIPDIHLVCLEKRV